jgi:nucleotide-binding universal stress UspA family protein
MPAPIIAAYDPLTDDRTPVELALAVARSTGAPLTVAAVLPWDDAVDTDLEVELEERAADALQRLQADLGVETRTLHELSVPAALHRTAHDEGAGLIVVGSTTRGPIGRVVTGSTAQRLLHGAPCPILLAPRGLEPAPLRTIAVGFMDSPEGHAALRAGHLLARSSGARLRVIAVLHPSGGLAGPGKPERESRLQGERRLQVEASLRDAVAALEPGVDVETELHVDDAADVLVRISQHVDLLVCGSRGYGPLRSVLLGGVSRRVVDEAESPVLVLPRDAEHPLEDLLALDAATG